MPQRSETDGHVELVSKRRIQDIAVHELKFGFTIRCRRRLASNLQHAAAKVDADDSIAAQRPQHLHSRSGPAAEVKRRINRLGFADQWGDKFQQRIRRPKRSVIELWCEQIITAFGRRQCLFR